MSHRTRKALCRLSMASGLLLAYGVSALVAAEIPGSDSQETLESALGFDWNRDQSRLIRTAVEAIDEGDLVRVVEALQEVLDGPAETLVQMGNRYVNARREANRLLAELPAEGRKLYERRSGAGADALLTSALEQREPRLLEEVASRYRQTAAGRRALRLLAQQQFDHGEFSAAAASFSALFESAPVPDQAARNDAAGVVAWVAALLSAERVEAAHAVGSRYRPALAGRPESDELARLLAGTPLEEAETGGIEGDLTSVLPSAERKWIVASQHPEGEQASVADDLRRLARGSVPSYLQRRPVVRGERVVIRSATDLSCVDVETGEVHWTFDLAAPRHDPANGGIAPPPPAARTVERALGDGVHSSMTVDDEQVYVLRPRQVTAGVGVAPPDPDAPPANELVAVGLADGRPRWTIESIASGESEPEQTARPPVYFRSPPTPWESRLLICGEHDGILSLLVLNRTDGTIEDAIRLCSTEFAAERDDRRWGTVAPVAASKGTAYCSTGGGALIAVDLQTQKIAWATRYPREPLPAPRSRDDVLRRADRQLVWPLGWRETFLQRAGESVVLASPESERLWVFDSETGAVRWSMPRGDGLYVAGVFDGRILIVGRWEVAAVELERGEVLWKSAVGVTSGEGVAVAGHYLVPTHGGGCSAVDVSDGNIRRVYGIEDRPVVVRSGSPRHTENSLQPVSLAWSSSGVIRQSLESTELPTDLKSAIAAAEQEFLDGEGRAQEAFRLARLRRQSGQLHSAAELIEQQLTESGLSEELISKLQAELLDVLVLLAVEERASTESLFRRAEPYLAAEVQRAEWAWLRLEANQDAAVAEVVLRAFEIFDLDSREFFVRISEEHTVRLDRAVQAALLSRRESASEDERAVFDAAIEEGVAQRTSDGNGLTRARLADDLSQFAAGRRLRLSLPLAWSSAEQFVELQVRLLSLANSGDGPAAAASLRRLGELYAAHDDPDEARAIYRRLRDRYADVVLPDGTNVDSVLADVAPEHPGEAGFLDEPPSRWPDARPDVSMREWPEGELYFVPVSVDAAPGSLFDRLNVAVYRIESRENRGLVVRFSGAGFHRPWSLTLPLKGSPLRSAFSFADLRRAWGFGQLLVLQVGADVFGIAPLDAAGEPRATIVWPDSGREIRATEDPAMLVPRGQVTALQSQVAEFGDGPERVDSLGHLVGAVGPVRAGYFCVQQAGTVVAYETATGRELWRRTGLRPGVRSVGDDEFVVLISNSQDRLVTLSPVDGSIVSEAFLKLPADAVWLTTYGRRALIRGPSGSDRSSGDSIVLVDLATNRELWRLPISETAVCFPVDSRRCGTLTPEGIVQFVSLADGAITATHQVETPERMVRVRTLLDPERIFLVVSGPRDDPLLEQATPGAGIQSNEDHRRLIVNGWMSAFDRATERHLWSTRIDHASIALDQDVDVPVLVLNELRRDSGAEGGASFRGRVRCLDRRSGEILLDEETAAMHNYFLIERDADAGWVELRLPKRIFRLDYAGGSPGAGTEE